MASTTRTRSAPARSTRKPARGSQPGFIDRIKAQAAQAADALPHIAGSSRLRREVLGFVLVVVAILTAVVLGRGGDDGRLVDWWGGILADSFGRAAPLVPLLTGLVALRALGSQPGPILEGRHYLGGFLFTVAVVGLLQLGAGLDDPAAGGYLGIAVATLTLRILGQLGSGLVLFVGGVFAVFLLAGSDLQTFWADLRALAAFIAGACATAWAAVVRAAKFAAPARPRGIPVDDGPAPDPAPGRRPANDLTASEIEAEWRPKPVAGGRKRVAARAAAEPALAVAEPVAALRSGMTVTLDAPAPEPAHAAEPEARQEPVIVMAPPARRIPAADALPDIDPDSADDSLDRLLDAAMEEGTPTPPRPRASRSRSSGRASGAAAAVADEPVEAEEERAIPINRLEPERAATAAPTLPVISGRERVAASRLPMPDLARLAYYDSVEPDTGSLHAKARVIEATLSSFRVEARVREINPGPAVTQFALEPGTGTKVRRITELQNDLALALAAPSVRIEAPIPGMARVGLEIPNEQIATVGLRETLESSTFSKGKAKLPIPLGRDVNGRYVVGDLTRMPHLLIAGSTGSGKSVCLNCIISTFLITLQPDELKLVMIDPKMVELTGYNGVPHLQCPVVTEMDKVVGTLRLVLREMERRYTMFANLGVRNLDGYRDKVADEPGAEKLPYLVVIIDELADLMMTAPDDVEGLLVRLAQMARATGIHLIIATQRPSVDVVTGLIKANVPSRVAFAVSSLTDSRVVLDMPGAERLLGRGDMLYLPADAAKPQRIQGAFLEDKDAQYIVNHWHTHAPVPQFAQEWLDVESSGKSSGNGGGGEAGEWEDDPLFEQALHLVRAQGTASASMLQRRLRVGYNRAARLIERMEDEGYIGPADGVRGRPVLLVDD